MCSHMATLLVYAIAAFLLSVCCEVLQFATGRGMADVNDVLFNTLGAFAGVWMAESIKK